MNQIQYALSGKATIQTANSLHLDVMPNVHANNTFSNITNTQDTVFRSTVVNEIGLLKTTVDALKEDLQVLKGHLCSRASVSNDDCDTSLFILCKVQTSHFLNTE